MKRIALFCISGLLVTGSSMQLAFAQTTSADAPGYDDAGHGKYPRVTQLEQDLLGQTYVNDPLPTRVSRLEMKQYGKVSTGDMCDRLDKLDEIVKPASLAPKGYVSDEVQVDPDSGKPIIQTAAGTSAGGPSPSLGSYPRVTEL